MGSVLFLYAIAQVWLEDSLLRGASAKYLSMIKNFLFPLYSSHTASSVGKVVAMQHIENLPKSFHSNMC